MNIIFTINDLDYLDFKINFLKEQPLPSDSTLSEDEWIKEWGRRQYLAIVERGKRKLAQELSMVEDKIIQCKS